MPRRPRLRDARLALMVCALLAACARTAHTPPAPPSNAAQITEESAARAAPNPLRNVYFGDLHLHTRNSYDAYIFNVRASPNDAYAYARGAVLQHPSGFEVRLHSGPLDFLAVTDHAEYLGVLEQAETPGTIYARAPMAAQLFSPDPATVIAAFAPFAQSIFTGRIIPELSDLSAPRSAWRDTIESAERNNDPGRFTTFIGYEFTAMPGARNLHRNVIFAGGAAPPLPYSSLESQNPEDLWRWLDQRRAEGMEAVAIPHNSNASDGAMFDRTRFDGRPIDRAYAELRLRNEPIAEITQNKGQSETMPLLSPNDEFAGFEVMDRYVGANTPITHFSGGYMRDALRRGLEIEDQIGANPYRLGIVAGSDGHNGAAPYEEDNYFANHGVLDGMPARRGSVPPPTFRTWEDFYANGGSPPRAAGSGGLTGVWAEENTRASLFAALRRRETFGTTGPRIRVRFFAGYGLSGVDLATDAGVRTAYARGAPMGGEFPVQGTRSPHFAAVALRDINSAPLQRLQIIKGWTDSSGRSFEQVFDIACADGGAISPATHRCADNGADVDLATCAFAQDKGDAQLQAVWIDPTFDARQNAFYYVRVLENPTCRWSTWDAVRAHVSPNPQLPATVQERAYTSPIWVIPTHGR